MNTKTLYRLYHIETNSVLLYDTDYSCMVDGYAKLGEICIPYENELTVEDKLFLEKELEKSKQKCLAKAQIIQERIETFRCIEYVPGHNAMEEGHSEQS